MEILRAEHLTKIYGKGNTSVTAVNDLSLSVAQGEFVAVVGSSGSGKSTLLHMLGGVDQPTEGKVWIQGEDIYTLSTEKLAIFRRRQIGLIYQFFNLIPTLNVEENITLPCELDGQTVDKKRLDKLFYPQLGVKLCSMAGGGVQKIYMVFLREPSRRDRSGSDLFHLRDGFEIKMNFDRNVSCFIFVNALMHDDFFD